MEILGHSQINMTSKYAHMLLGPLETTGAKLRDLCARAPGCWRQSVPADAKAADVGRSDHGLLGSAADPSREELGLNRHRIDGERSDVALELEREILVGGGARRPV